MRFALLADELPAGHHAEHLRAFVQEVDAEEAALVLHAVALAEWQRAHRHCPRCGTALEVAQAGHLMVCPGCGRQQFPRTDPAVIMLVTDAEDRCLLGRQAAWPEGRYSTLAGFVEPGESLEHAVAREVEEEVGVVVDEVAYFGNQPWPFPASLMVGFFARARTTEISVDGAEIERRPLVHPRADARRGRGRHAAAARRHLDLPVAGRDLVRRPAPRPVVTCESARSQFSEASLALTSATEGFVWAVPSA